MRLASLALLTLLTAAVARAAEPPPDVSAIVARLLPATVIVTTLHITPGKDGPHREIFHGSGFIIDPSGLIVTNNHVADGAAEMSVTLHDRTVLPASLVGQDELTDLAVLKVHAEGPLPTVKWGDSESVRIGQPVIVVGDPYNVGISVSTGVISALGRDMKEGPYDDYIQTDAAINHGNSGGPMLDLQGEVIGVAAVVYSPSASGGSVGVGFGIPSNVAQFVVSQLVRQGYVRRGWLGAFIQDLTPAMADGFGLLRPEGAVIVEPVPGGPAAKAGLESGDVVLRFGDRPVQDFRGLSRDVATQEVGTSVPLIVWRDGAQKTLMVTIAERPGAPEHPTPPPAALAAVAQPDLGLALAPIDAAARSRYHLAESQTGLLISDVTPGSTAADQGLHAGDVILRVQDQAAASAEVMRQEITRQRAGHRDHVLLLVQSPGETRWVALRLT
jgi:serine protease Do